MENIVLICDDAYALPTMVCVQSIIKGIDSQECYNIHICSFELNEINVALLEGLSVPNVSVCVHLLPKSAIEDKLSFVKQQTHVTPTALIKLELANYFPELDKLLYLDSDIVVKGSLGPLFETNIEHAYLAACFEYWKYYENLRFNPKANKNADFYFNSGVMLLNLRKMREDNISDQLWFYKLNNTKTKLMDQECLNAVCGQSVVQLPVKWNFNPVFLHNEHLKGINTVYQEQYVDTEQLLEDVRIVHYVGKQDKPWVYKTARLRCYWDDAYLSTEGLPAFSLKDAPAERKNILAASAEKLKTYGILGYLHFVWYRLCRLVRR